MQSRLSSRHPHVLPPNRKLTRDEAEKFGAQAVWYATVALVLGVIVWALSLAAWQGQHNTKAVRHGRGEAQVTFHPFSRGARNAWAGRSSQYL